jgi:single-strand DNA-binding protein
MASLNKVMLIGNLTRDPELRYTPKGSAVLDLTVACNRSYVTESNEKVQETTFVDTVAWGRQAEVIAQYVKKGNPIYIEGRLQVDSWEDKTNGQKRYKTRVVVENFQFLSGKRDDEGGGAPQGQGGGYEGGGGYGGGGGGGYQQRSPRPQGGGGGNGSSSSGGGGSGGGYQQRSSPPARQQPPPSADHDSFGDGPITGGMDDDEIPF